MSFLRPELAAWLRHWREAIGWALLALVGGWLAWGGYQRLALLPFVAGVGLATVGIGLLRDAVRRARLLAAAPGEGVVVIDEARIAYLGPHGGGVVDLPAIVRVEIVTRPHAFGESAHAWLITSEDGAHLAIPLGATGAERLIDALSPLPGIDLDAGAAAVAAGRAGSALVWRKAG